MRTSPSLVFGGRLHARVRQHLFPGDALEAAAILMCSPAGAVRPKLIVRDAILVPYGACAVRNPDRLTWPGGYLEEAFDRAEAEGLSLVLIHSHPGGFFGFSPLDDDSDRGTMAAIHLALPGTAERRALHASAVMIPSGAVRARVYEDAVRSQPVGLVSVIGDDLHFWFDVGASDEGPSSRPMAFTSDMTAQLNELSVAIVGVSGTGSLVAEQAARLGFGEIILVDFDRVKLRNLNRIVNSTMEDAGQERLKVEMFAAAIRRYRRDVVVREVPTTLRARDAVLQASDADVVCSCVDTVEGRQLCDRLAAAFGQALFDVGVSIPVRRIGDGRHAVGDVLGRIDYVQPGGSTLLDRGVWTPALLRAEYLAASAPDAFDREIREGYLRGFPEQAPSVIALNMRAAGAVACEFIARAYPYRLDDNSLYARTRFSLAASEEEYFSESDFTVAQNSTLCAGAAEPLLGIPSLAPQRRRCSR